MNPKVDAYIARSNKWPKEMTALQAVLLGCELDEEIMQEMNDFLALMFFKGALLRDPQGVLKEQGPNSRSALRMEFTSVDDVTAMADTIGAYVTEAIAVEAAGLTVEPAPDLVLVDELQQRLDDDAELKAAFEALTPGRRREYNLIIGDAKQSTTRAARVEKYVERILAGKGLRDQ
jgi:uncharacterized protein YdeI (YjbR/CyaY-like superfamily)